jgi:signal transduction histidine kinase
MYEHVQELLRQLDQLIKPDGEQMVLAPRVDELEHALRDLSELNRVHLVSSQRGVLKRERRFAYYSFALDGMALLLALAAAWLVARTVRGYVLRIERRTAELEHLAVQVGHEIGNPLTPLTLALEGCVGLESGALARGQKAIARIRRSVDRLIGFAESGRVPPGRAAATEVGQALHGLDVELHGDAHARVACEPEVLRGVVADLVQVAAEAPQQLLYLEVQVRPFHVRLAAVCAVGNGGARSIDPFDPQMHEIESGHPGIDLRLATVRRRVEARGGAVGVRDARGERVLWLDLARG